MATVRKSITLTEQQDQWIKFQLEKGDFTNESEYIRDLLRRDQSQHQKLLELKAAIDEGLNSGVSDRSVEDIMNDVEAKMRADGRL